MEFHSPQASQRPDHLEAAAPQAVQVKVSGLAIPAFVAAIAWGQTFRRRADHGKAAKPLFYRHKIRF